MKRSTLAGDNWCMVFVGKEDFLHIDLGCGAIEACKTVPGFDTTEHSWVTAWRECEELGSNVAKVTTVSSPSSAAQEVPTLPTECDRNSSTNGIETFHNKQRQPETRSHAEPKRTINPVLCMSGTNRAQV
uniref:Uncharacterized protein n=1 Tax=Physcomitrium patens TaxID=3218 RepID=A0A2K1JP94_PHYPA|nr:hypothetical protein PHYPA_015728 [Physcomitrium patens]